MVNRKWILSAAHCFCTRTSCTADGPNGASVDFSPAEHVRVIVGLNDVALVARYKELIRIPDRIVLHPAYTNEEEAISADVALLRLSGDNLNFTDPRIKVRRLGRLSTN